MKMKRSLDELLIGQTYTILQGNNQMEVSGVAWDTRSMEPNSLFICVKSRNVDRHEFIELAIENGATALLIEQEIKGIPSNITVLQVEDTRKAMSLVAQHFYKTPMEKLKMVGITGTNGKTSTSHFIAQVLNSLGKRTGLIGTIQNTVGEKELKTKKLNPTTPDALELQASLAEIVESGAQYSIMEVTSSALVQERVYGCKFHIGVFTNLTQDHLEEHGTVDVYKAAKMKLFHQCQIGIINSDDGIGQEILDQGACHMLTYGTGEGANLRATHITYGIHQVSFRLHYKDITKEVIFNVPGRFSVYNALATIGTVLSLGYQLDEILQVLSHIEGVPGRFQVIPNDIEALVIVDYAHSPDSLENILQCAKELTEGKLIVVFGCGGDRDSIKRPIMGEIAGKYADFIVITSDNPRTENPEKIICHIEEGVKKSGKPYKKLEDRKVAILHALAKVQKGDTVVIAGKGHEDYQIIGNQKIPMNDIEIATNYLKNNGSSIKNSSF